ncbi:MAG: sigma-54-dependent Fis family transcriptional regulator [Deltaproteobacteria bacterium]|nr:sigma-54-dependent Fis family transcriptional regulator [Deltaproteobacteria bacterium]
MIFSSDKSSSDEYLDYNEAENGERSSDNIRVLVVDDDASSLRSVERILKSKGFWVFSSTDGEAAIEVMKEANVDVMLVDLVMPKMNGLEVLKTVKAESRYIQVVMMTAFGDVDSAVEAVKEGAYDFLTKPFQSADALALSVKKAANHSKLLKKNDELEKELEVHERYGNIIGASSPMMSVYKMVESVAHTASTVLIEGDSGTGKELVARAIHSRGPRANMPFIPVNCSAIPETLVEAELFGHVRGAFTGAVENRKGLFEAADGGTIMLDEIGDLPLQVQVKLLRTLQEGEIKRVGSNESIKVNARVVAATNVNIIDAMERGVFRQDLYYRLSVITITMPPLRDRAEDIPLIAYHFLKKYSQRAGRNINRISIEAMRALRSHAWPGNVRELENAIERAVVMARNDVILPGDLPQSVIDTRNPSMPQDILLDLPFNEAKKKSVELFESGYAKGMLKRAGGNVSEAARQSGMDRSNFRRILRKYK